MSVSSSFLNWNWFITGLLLHSSDWRSGAVNQLLETFECHLLKDRAVIHPQICKCIVILLDLMTDVGPLAVTLLLCLSQAGSPILTPSSPDRTGGRAPQTSEPCQSTITAQMSDQKDCGCLCGIR